MMGEDKRRTTGQGLTSADNHRRAAKALRAAGFDQFLEKQLDLALAGRPFRAPSNCRAIVGALVLGAVERLPTYASILDRMTDGSVFPRVSASTSHNTAENQPNPVTFDDLASLQRTIPDEALAQIVLLGSTIVQGAIGSDTASSGQNHDETEMEDYLRQLAANSHVRTRREIELLASFVVAGAAGILIAVVLAVLGAVYGVRWLSALSLFVGESGLLLVVRGSRRGRWYTVDAVLAAGLVMLLLWLLPLGDITSKLALQLSPVLFATSASVDLMQTRRSRRGALPPVPFLVFSLATAGAAFLLPIWAVSVPKTLGCIAWVNGLVLSNSWKGRSNLRNSLPALGVGAVLLLLWSLAPGDVLPHWLVLVVLALPVASVPYSWLHDRQQTNGFCHDGTKLQDFTAWLSRPSSQVVDIVVVPAATSGVDGPTVEKELAVAAIMGRTIASIRLDRFAAMVQQTRESGVCIGSVVLVMARGEENEEGASTAYRRVIACTGHPPDLVCYDEAVAELAPLSRYAAASWAASPAAVALSSISSGSNAACWLINEIDGELVNAIPVVCSRWRRCPLRAAELSAEEREDFREFSHHAPPHLAVMAASLWNEETEGGLVVGSMRVTFELLRFLCLCCGRDLRSKGVEMPSVVGLTGGYGWSWLRDPRLERFEAESSVIAVAREVVRPSVLPLDLVDALRDALGPLLSADQAEKLNGETLGVWIHVLGQLDNAFRHGRVRVEMFNESGAGTAVARLFLHLTKRVLPLFHDGRLAVGVGGPARKGLMGLTDAGLADDNPGASLQWVIGSSNIWLDLAPEVGPCASSVAFPGDYLVLSMVKGRAEPVRRLASGLNDAELARAAGVDGRLKERPLKDGIAPDPDYPGTITFLPDRARFSGTERSNASIAPADSSAAAESHPAHRPWQLDLPLIRRLYTSPRYRFVVALSLASVLLVVVALLVPAYTAVLAIATGVLALGAIVLAVFESNAPGSVDPREDLILYHEWAWPKFVRKMRRHTGSMLDRALFVDDERELACFGSPWRGSIRVACVPMGPAGPAERTCYRNLLNDPLAIPVIAMQGPWQQRYAAEVPELDLLLRLGRGIDMSQSEKPTHAQFIAAQRAAVANARYLDTTLSKKLATVIERGPTSLALRWRSLLYEENDVVRVRDLIHVYEQHVALAVLMLAAWSGDSLQTFERDLVGSFSFGGWTGGLSQWSSKERTRRYGGELLTVASSLRDTQVDAQVDEQLREAIESVFGVRTKASRKLVAHLQQVVMARNLAKTGLPATPSQLRRLWDALSGSYCALLDATPWLLAPQPSAEAGATWVCAGTTVEPGQVRRAVGIDAAIGGRGPLQSAATDGATGSVLVVYAPGMAPAVVPSRDLFQVEVRYGGLDILALNEVVDGVPVFAPPQLAPMGPDNAGSPRTH
jgi:hypothetical protein